MNGKIYRKKWLWPILRKYQTLLSNEYQKLFPWGQIGLGVKLTTHLQLVPRSMRGAIYPLPQYAFTAWCSVKKRAQGQLLLLSPQKA